MKGKETPCEGVCHAPRWRLHPTSLCCLFVTSGAWFGLVGGICERYSSYTQGDAGLMGHI